MEAFKAAMNVYISYKFGELLSGSSAVNCVQQASISTWLIHLRSSGGSTFAFFYCSLGGDTAMLDGLYISSFVLFYVWCADGFTWTVNEYLLRESDVYVYLRGHNGDGQL